jgi:hypothetical protein
MRSKKAFKNKPHKYNYMKIDDCVKITGGKSKNCEAIIMSIKAQFAMVKITKDKKGTPMFSDKPTKVKKIYCELIEPSPIEMPTNDDLKVVDTLDDHNVFEMLDKKLSQNKKEVESESDHENSNPNEIAEKKKKANTSFMINENNVKEPAITMDDAINYREENTMLKFKMDSMVNFQSLACQEIAELKMDIKGLKEQLADSIRLEKLESVLKKILDDI